MLVFLNEFSLQGQLDRVQSSLLQKVTWFEAKVRYALIFFFLISINTTEKTKNK